MADIEGYAIAFFLIFRSISSTTGIVSPSLNFNISHSSKTSTSSFLHFSTVLPFAQTPSNEGISANQVSSANFLYSAFSIAFCTYSIIMGYPPAGVDPSYYFNYSKLLLSMCFRGCASVCFSVVSSGCILRIIPATDSESFRPTVPFYSNDPFLSKPATPPGENLDLSPKHARQCPSCNQCEFNFLISDECLS